jgi:hypothetical protein
LRKNQKWEFDWSAWCEDTPDDKVAKHDFTDAVKAALKADRAKRMRKRVGIFSASQRESAFLLHVSSVAAQAYFSVAK